MKSATVKQFGENLFISSTFVKFYGATLQTRMAVIKADNNQLLIYSPIFLTDQIKQSLADLGTVTWIIAPNKIHNQGLADYIEAFPDAKIFAAPGLKERCPQLKVDNVLHGYQANFLSPDIDMITTQGNSFFSEVLLLHKPSKTLIVADFIENMTKTTTSMLWLFKLFGVREKPMSSPEFRMYTTNAQQAQEALEIVDSWDFQQIFLCHGELITTNAGGVFNRVCEKFLEQIERRSELTKGLYSQLSKLQ
ncbi:DUF4336 domain-containing protein [Thalassotalea litorea]|uniref:DUF4336 domain-containing protein n=1 Tax=Thalassotalea litorea TaxID=2020715 RepID=A0A5R9IL86_9GAMM|nr:DUF4336 domain-containing protein [Thalassotalea litorea]TLU66295.1 DUF4336 domain-containing protein [Thalassotalea litorea]